MDKITRLLLWLIILVPACSNAKKHSIEVVVHRGANALAPENTIASADSALAHGAKWIEVDVRPSKDGVLYNLHDEFLNRTTNGRGNASTGFSTRISDWMAKDIDTLDCGSWFSEKYRGTRIPTIEAMIDALKGRAYIYFDVKPGTKVADIVNLVRKKNYASRSFFWFAKEDMLREFVKLAPEMAVKVNASDTKRLDYWCTICKPAIVEVNADKITPAFLAYCHKNKIKVMVGAQGESVNDYRTAIETGADMINLDKPELFEQVIREANSLHGASTCGMSMASHSRTSK